MGFEEVGGESEITEPCRPIIDVPCRNPFADVKEVKKAERSAIRRSGGAIL
jgi:hypothetical protein